MSKSSNPTCRVDECDREARTRGWCSRHYHRVQRYGDPLGGRQYSNTYTKGQRCAVEGCDNKIAARGLCKKHDYRQSRYGDPLGSAKAQGIVVAPLGRIQRCECGCGELAGLHAGSNKAAGIVAGTPKRFVHGHHNRLTRYHRDGAPFDERYTVQPNGCWIWNDADPVWESGYGRITIGKTRHSAHRFSWERVNGPIPDGARLDHTCHDPAVCPGGVNCPHRACVNPDHLEVVSHAENCRRGANAKLNAIQADEIRRRRAAGETGVALAAEFGVRPSAISWITRTDGTWRGDE